MIEKVRLAFTWSGIALLLLAGIFLMIGHHPESFVANRQAETAANFAYGSLVIAVVVELLNKLRKSKPIEKDSKQA